MRIFAMLSVLAIAAQLQGAIGDAKAQGTSGTGKHAIRRSMQSMRNRRESDLRREIVSLRRENNKQKQVIISLTRRNQECLAILKRYSDVLHKMVGEYSDLQHKVATESPNLQRPASESNKAP